MGDRGNIPVFIYKILREKKKENKETEGENGHLGNDET